MEGNLSQRQMITIHLLSNLFLFLNMQNMMKKEYGDRSYDQSLLQDWKVIQKHLNGLKQYNYKHSSWFISCLRINTSSIESPLVFFLIDEKSPLVLTSLESDCCERSVSHKDEPEFLRSHFFLHVRVGRLFKFPALFSRISSLHTIFTLASVTFRFITFCFSNHSLWITVDGVLFHDGVYTTFLLDS